MFLLKIGGGKNINIENIAQDLVEISKKEQVIIVHGASATRDEIAEKLGIPTKTITSPSGIFSVYTDEVAIDVFLMTYCGLINKRVVATLQKYGINAVGLSGIDGKLWQAKRKEAVYAQENGKTKLITDNLTGRVEQVNSELLHLLLNNGYVPVLCPPAFSFDDQIVNTDNDWAVAMLAGALNAQTIVSLFEAPGFLKDVNDVTSVIPNIDKNDLKTMLQYAQGRMKKKLLGAQKAFELSVQKIYFGDGRIERPVTAAISGKGTIIS